MGVGQAAVREMLAALARRIGPGVRELAFRVPVEGGEALTPDNTELRAREADGRVLFAGRHGNLSVRWEFTFRDGGVCVRLEVTGERGLRCASVDSLVLTYQPGAAPLDDWRVLAFGAEEGLLTVADLEAAHRAQPPVGGVPTTLLCGAFPNSGEPGVFVGTLLPQRCLHRYDAARTPEGAVRLTATTHFPEGFSEAGKVASESSWLCATRPVGGAVDTFAAFLPATAPVTPPVGWNSWDYYFSAVWLDDVIENMDAIRQDPVLSRPVRTIVVDMGWESKEGEWYPNYRFPGGLERLTAEIERRGFVPGVWTAPVSVQTLSVPGLRAAEMLVKNDHGDPFVCGGQYLLDPTHPRAQEYLREIYTRLHQAGFRFFKVDYVSNVLRAPRFHDRSRGHLEVLRDLFRLIRECVGPESHLLGCSLPPEVGPGVVDSGRTGIDIHNHWSHVTWCFDALQLKYWLHGRVWVNDVDFLVVRGPDTSTEAVTNVTNPSAHLPNPPRWRRGPDLSAEEARTWASIVSLSGGSVFLSDRIAALNESGKRLLRQVITPTGVAARPLDLCDGERASLWLQQLPQEYRLTVINWADAPVTREIAFALLGLAAPARVTEWWSGASVPVADGALRLPLPAHGSAVLCWPR